MQRLNLSTDLTFDCFLIPVEGVVIIILWPSHREEEQT